MEATKEIKIILYILVVMVGLQMGFTFNKLNMMEDKIEAITMESDSTLAIGRYSPYKDDFGFKILDTATGEIWRKWTLYAKDDSTRTSNEVRWSRDYPKVGEVGFPQFGSPQY